MRMYYMGCYVHKYEKFKAPFNDFYIAVLTLHLFFAVLLLFTSIFELHGFFPIEVFLNRLYF